MPENKILLTNLAAEERFTHSLTCEVFLGSLLFAFPSNIAIETEKDIRTVK